MNDRAIAIALLEQRRSRKTKIFPEQDRFVEDPSRFVSALCTRRAGKSTGLGRRFKRTMDSYPGSLCRYLALTRDSAKDIMWNALQELNEAYNWRCEFQESTLTMIAPNKSKLRLYGADMKNFVRRLRGAKTAANAIDEAQEFSDQALESLVDDIIVPSMADYTNSWLALTGTPGPIPKGMFYDITELKKFGYSVHRWSLTDNPYMPDPVGFIESEKVRKGWTESSPSFLREYKGLWVLDVESLLVRYDSIADYESLPPDSYNYIMGIDIGFNDADAIAVLAWSRNSPTTYLLEETVVPQQGLTELVNQIQTLRSRYDISKLVIDEGGLGKKLAEELRRRHHIPVHPADKKRKLEGVAFLNDALRMGKFKARRTSRFAEDSMRVQIDQDKSTPDRIVVKKGFHSDIIDAVLYAFKESPAYSYVKPTYKPKYQSKEWYEAEERDMEQKALERAENQANQEEATEYY